MPFTGNLKLKIVEAFNLKPTQLSVRHSLVKNQSMLIDPFVSISVDDSTLERTSAKSRTFKPVWNEDFDMQLVDAKILQLTVFHKSAFPIDDFVANCSLQFDDILNDNDSIDSGSIESGNIESDLWVCWSP